jgi:GxxExxY protein
MVMTLVDAAGITQLSRRIIGAAMRVHTVFGPGLLESPYRLALVVELARADLRCEVEKALPVTYDNVSLGLGYRLDIVVEERIVLEIKAVPEILPVHRMQLLTYLRIGGYPAGLVLNFGVMRMKDGGIGRVLNDRAPGRFHSPDPQDPGRIDEY